MFATRIYFSNIASNGRNSAMHVLNSSASEVSRLHIGAEASQFLLINVEKLNSLTHCVRSQITRSKLQKSILGFSQSLGF